jgi:transposase
MGWIGAHTRAFAAVGGVPRLLVPDNAKVAVIKACLYEPQVNRTYAEMAAPTLTHPEWLALLLDRKVQLSA